MNTNRILIGFVSAGLLTFTVVTGLSIKQRKVAEGRYTVWLKDDYFPTYFATHKSWPQSLQGTKNALQAERANPKTDFAESSMLLELSTDANPILIVDSQNAHNVKGRILFHWRGGSSVNIDMDAK